MYEESPEYPMDAFVWVVALAGMLLNVIGAAAAATIAVLDVGTLAVLVVVVAFVVEIVGAVSVTEVSFQGRLPRTAELSSAAVGSLMAAVVPIPVDVPPPQAATNDEPNVMANAKWQELRCICMEPLRSAGTEHGRGVAHALSIAMQQSVQSVGTARVSDWRLR